MDNTEALKNMLQDIINDRQEQATVTIHDYIVAKTREISGLNTQVAPEADLEPNEAE